MQLIKHLHAKTDDTISNLFHVVTIRAIPAAWSTSKLAPVFKKGDKTLASNYRLVSVVGLMAKLNATYLTGTLEEPSPTIGMLQPKQVSDDIIILKS